jgi:hypothetical protein
LRRDRGWPKGLALERKFKKKAMPDWRGSFDVRTDRSSAGKRAAEWGTGVDGGILRGLSRPGKSPQCGFDHIKATIEHRSRCAPSTAADC